MQLTLSKLGPGDESHVPPIVAGWLGHNERDAALWGAQGLGKADNVQQALSNHIETQMQSPESNIFILKMNRSTVGYGEITRIDHSERSASLSRLIIRPSSRGRGYGCVLTTGLAAKCFDELLLDRVDLRVMAINNNAQCLYEKAGFAVDAVVQNARTFTHETWDLVEMSLSRNRWRQRQPKGE